MTPETVVVEAPLERRHGAHLAAEGIEAGPPVEVPADQALSATALVLLAGGMFRALVEAGES